ncbi:branched-chain amino acid ABC transporter permease [Pelagibius sp. Alg239-R121]|uniref:branched-chain amino acid ABC transporter permease n=1 Tax=Pelagibius sp. Alg239-R121 TaxID=2993448 RepID=UPI0024A74959|nr:branched-chain amino acid ABC transporter permease [Pelagibius sp. Alg239-R121]
MMKTTTSKLAVLGIALVVVLVILPLIFSGKLYYMGVLTTAMALSIAAAGVWLTFYIGRINIGQGAFALIGGYACAILIMKAEMSFWIAMPLAGVFSAIIGVLIGYPILRLRGVYFAMITLSLTETARLSAQSLSSLTGGAKGIINIPLPGALEIFGFTLIPDFSTIDSHLAFYYLAAVLLIATYAAMYRLVNSRIGWLFRSLQQNEDLASSIGVNIAMLRVIAFAISSFLAGIGGAFFVAVQQSVYPNTFQVQDSVYFMLYCFLGGLGYVFGPIVGTFVLFLSFEGLQGLNEYQPLVYSVLMIALMLWLPNGLLSLGEGRRDKAARSAASAKDANVADSDAKAKG